MLFLKYLINIIYANAHSQIYMSEEIHSISEVPIPEGISEFQKLQYESFRDSLCQMEQELQELENGNNKDYLEFLSVIDEIKATRQKQADERLRLKLEVIEKHTNSELERIERENDESKILLHDRMIRSYKACYDETLSKLKELMNEDEFNLFVNENRIDFPDIQPDLQMKTRLQQPNELKVKLSPEEIENDLKQIQLGACKIENT